MQGIKLVKTEIWTKFDAINIKLCFDRNILDGIFISTGNIKFLSKTGDADEYFSIPYFVANNPIMANQPLNCRLTSSLMIWSKRDKKQTITYNVFLQDHHANKICETTV